MLAAYLAGTGLLLLLGPGLASTAGVLAHLMALGVVVAATWLPGIRPWLRAWAPLLTLLFLYSEIPQLIAAAGHTGVYDTAVMEWERALFGGQPAVDWAARVPSSALSELLHAAYLAYYPIIFSVPAALQWQKRDADVSRAVFVLLLTFIACFAAYIVFPVAGPRYLWSSPAAELGGASRAFAEFLLESQSSRGTAFPSSHVAVATAQSLLAMFYFGRRGLFVAVPTVLLAIGAVYGGFHYLIDVIAGALTGLAAAGVGLWFIRSRASAAQRNAIAPT